MKKIIVICLIFLPALIFLWVNTDVAANTHGASPKNLTTSDTTPSHIDSLVYTETAKIIASDYEDGDTFGQSFDVDGNYLVVGNPTDDDYGIEYGAVYIFERLDGFNVWTETKIITPTLGEDRENFGWSVAISGTTVVVGSLQIGTYRGEAYVYEKDYGGVGNWGLVKQLAPSDLPDSSGFGRAVDIDGDTIVVGAYYYSLRCEGCGSAFVFERNLGGDNNWGLSKELYDPVGNEDERYGLHVSLYQDTLIVSASQRVPSGAVFVHYRDYGGIDNWGNVKILQSPASIETCDKPMRTNGAIAVIGTQENNIKIYGRDFGGTDNWGFLRSLGGGLSFGMGVDIFNNNVIVGEPDHPEYEIHTGAAYMFSTYDEDFSNWSQEGQVLASDGGEGDGFGNQVKITADELFISAYGADINGINAGAIYIYHYEIIHNSDLTISKTDNPDPVIIGSVLTYTISVNNLGPDTALDVSVTDTLPDDVIFNNASPGCTETDGNVTCDVGNLSPDASTDIMIEVIAPGVEGSIINTATVTGEVVDPNPDNNTATEETTIIPPPTDLWISIEDIPDPVLVSSPLTYTLLVNNGGPNDVTSVMVEDYLPSGAQFENASPGCTESSNVVTCNVGNISNGEVYTITIVVSAPNVTGTITNYANVQYTGFDPLPGNNHDDEYTIVVDTIADLQITSIIDEPDPVLTGNYLSYTIHIYNAGPGFAQDIYLSNILSDGVVFVSGQNCEYAGGPEYVVICHADSLISHGNIDFNFIVITPSVQGNIISSAYVNGFVFDPDLENNTDIEYTSVLYELIFENLMPIVFR